MHINLPGGNLLYELSTKWSCNSVFTGKSNYNTKFILCIWLCFDWFFAYFDARTFTKHILHTYTKASAWEGIRLETSVMWCCVIQYMATTVSEQSDTSIYSILDYIVSHSKIINLIFTTVRIQNFTFSARWIQFISLQTIKTKLILTSTSHLVL
jgi:hypothetical protein